MNGKLTGLVSCQALLEGFNAPHATVCLWARPTKSGLLYTQGTGRVLRPFPAPVQAVPGNRPYQEDCLRDIRDGVLRGCNRQLMVLPTGGGKTRVFSQIPTTLGMRRPDKMLVIVQADELAFQAFEALQNANPDLKVGMEKAQYKSSWSDDIIVASVQTLGGSKLLDSGKWEWSRRIQNIDPVSVRYIVTDEAHHCSAPNYHGVLRYFGVMKSDPDYNDPLKYLLGATATPNRADNKGLESYFDEIVFSRDIRTMIRDGWLSNPVGHRVDTMVSLDGVSIRAGDFAKGELERTINTRERNKLIIDKYLELGEGAPFIALTVDIQHTVDLTTAFRERGIEVCGIASRSDDSCEWLASKERDRREVIDRFNKDWEGYTKKNAIILDFVDNFSKVGSSLVTAASLFGLRADFNMQGKKALDVVEEIERIKAAKPGLNASLYTDLDRLKAVSEKIDLFAVPTIPPEITGISQFAWTSGISEGTYQLSLPDKGLLTIKVNALGEYEIARHMTGIKKLIGVTKDLRSALRIADRSVPAEAMIILRSDSGWRRLPPSEAQLALYRRLYPEVRRTFPTETEFERFVRGQFSRGMMSALIGARDRRAGG